LKKNENMTSKIHSVLNEDNFDDLDQIIGSEKSKSQLSFNKERIVPVDRDDIELFNRRKSRKLPANRLKTRITSTPSIDLSVFVSKNAWYQFLFGKRTRKLGMPFILAATVLACCLEIFQAPFRYNLLLLLALEGSILYPKFPSKSVRPQLCLSVVMMISFCSDICLTYSYYRHSVKFIVLLAIFELFKSMVFYNFLLNVEGASRVRKYLDRRLRLFYIPLHVPKRIMRDVRGRFLAIGWLQAIALIGYCVFCIFFNFYYDYKSFYLSTSLATSLSVFLLGKCITSFIIFSGLLYDTDVRLCLWYFGCLGFALGYVRNYIKEKKKKLGGFPLVFSYYHLRFYILMGCKLIDFLWGCYGWVLIFPFIFLAPSTTIELELKIFIYFLAFFLFVTDIYYSLLFLGIRWLLYRHKILQKLHLLEKSDDSEIEEFRLEKEVEEAKETDLLLSKTKTSNSSLIEKDSKDKISESRNSVPLDKIQYSLKYKQRPGSTRSQKILPIFSNTKDHYGSSSSEEEGQNKADTYSRSTKGSLTDGKLIVDDEVVDILDSQIVSKTKAKKKATSNPLHSNVDV
jgi:hypothetical protein